MLIGYGLVFLYCFYIVLIDMSHKLPQARFVIGAVIIITVISFAALIYWIKV